MTCLRSQARSFVTEFTLEQGLEFTLERSEGLREEDKRRGKWFTGRVNRRKWRHTILPSLGGIARALDLAGALHPGAIVIRRMVMELGGGRQMEPLRIAFVSDLHLGALAGRDRLEKIVSMINGEIPDLVLLGGDYTYRAPLASLNELFQPLRQLRARLGVFSVFGNHDQARHDERRSEALSRLFASYGIRVLRNEWVRLEEQLHLVGIDDVGTRKADLVRAVRGLPAHQLTVFLAHNADFLLDVHPSQVFPESGERGFLWLFGHTHGGQVRLPWIGPLYRSGKAPWVLGRYQTEWGTMVVTAGVGEIYLPIRIGCPPEIVVIDCR